MEDISIFHLFVLTVSLTVTVQLLRRRFIDKKASSTLMNLLLLADVPFVIGGLILLYQINAELRCCEYPEWLITLSIILVEFGIIVLVCFIVNEWFRSIKSTSSPSKAFIKRVKEFYQSKNEQPSKSFIKSTWVLYKNEINKPSKSFLKNVEALFQNSTHKPSADFIKNAWDLYYTEIDTPSAEIIKKTWDLYKKEIDEKES